MLTLIVLLICLSTYLGRTFTRIKTYKEGFSGTIRTFSVIGDRLSPFVSCACVILAINNIFNRNWSKFKQYLYNESYFNKNSIIYINIIIWKYK